MDTGGLKDIPLPGSKEDDKQQPIAGASAAVPPGVGVSGKLVAAKGGPDEFDEAVAEEDQVQNGGEAKVDSSEEDNSKESSDTEEDQGQSGNSSDVENQGRDDQHSASDEERIRQRDRERQLKQAGVEMENGQEKPTISVNSYGSGTVHLTTNHSKFKLEGEGRLYLITGSNNIVTLTGMNCRLIAEGQNNSIYYHPDGCNEIMARGAENIAAALVNGVSAGGEPSQIMVEFRASSADNLHVKPKSVEKESPAPSVESELEREKKAKGQQKTAKESTGFLSRLKTALRMNGGQNKAAQDGTSNATPSTSTEIEPSSGNIVAPGHLSPALAQQLPAGVQTDRTNDNLEEPTPGSSKTQRKRRSSQESPQKAKNLKAGAENNQALVNDVEEAAPAPVLIPAMEVQENGIPPPALNNGGGDGSGASQNDPPAPAPAPAPAPGPASAEQRQQQLDETIAQQLDLQERLGMNAQQQPVQQIARNAEPQNQQQPGENADAEQQNQPDANAQQQPGSSRQGAQNQPPREEDNQQAPQAQPLRRETNSSRRLIIDEQNQAYEASLKADREKAEKKEQERQEKLKKEEEKKAEEQRQKKLKDDAREKLPEEPVRKPEGGEDGIFTLQFRVGPTNISFQRNFRPTDTLQTLQQFIFSHPETPFTFYVVRRPHQIIPMGSQEPEKTLKDLGFGVSEVLYINEGEAPAPPPAVEEVKTSPAPAVAEVKPSPPPAMEEVKPSPAPAVEEVKPSPPPAVEEVKPSPAVEEPQKSTPPPAVDQVQPSPSPPVDEVKPAQISKQE